MSVPPAGPSIVSVQRAAVSPRRGHGSSRSTAIERACSSYRSPARSRRAGCPRVGGVDQRLPALVRPAAGRTNAIGSSPALKHHQQRVADDRARRARRPRRSRRRSAARRGSARRASSTSRRSSRRPTDRATRCRARRRRGCRRPWKNLRRRSTGWSFQMRISRRVNSRKSRCSGVQVPVGPADLVVLAVRVVVAVLRAADLVAAADHRHAEREHQRRHEVAPLTVAQLERRAGRRSALRRRSSS